MWRVMVSSKKVNFKQKNNDILRCSKTWLVRVLSKCASWSKAKGTVYKRRPALPRRAPADDS